MHYEDKYNSNQSRINQCGSGGTALAVFLTYLLHCLTLGALHLSDFESVHLVGLLCIMAQSAHIQFTTARCLQYTEMCE